MKLKKKKNQSVGVLVLFRRGTKYRKKKVTAETKAKAIQKLPHMRIHLICSHQTQTLMWMPSSAC